MVAVSLKKKRRWLGWNRGHRSEGPAAILLYLAYHVVCEFEINEHEVDELEVHAIGKRGSHQSVVRVELVIFLHEANLERYHERRVVVKM